MAEMMDVPRSGSRRMPIRCREYGIIDAPAEEIFGPGGRLALVDGVLNRYVKADFRDNQLRLSAMGVTGLIPLTKNLTVQVMPRFPVRNLTHMVTVCGYVPTVLSALREYRSTDEWSRWLMDVMADALLEAIDTIINNGMLRTYHRRTEISAYPHGRIDSTATMLRLVARGVTHRAQYSWFERTVDNPVNRCLKLALVKLSAHYQRGPRVKGVRQRITRVAAALRAFDGVKLESYPVSLEDDEVRGLRPLPATRAYYRPAVELAVAVLNGQGISLDTPGTGISLPSLLVKTEDLFEQFVRLSLKTAFSADSLISVFDGNKDEGRLPLYEKVPGVRLQALPEECVDLLDLGTQPSAEPDLVFRLADGTHPLVADVKYTNVKAHANRSEVEQIALYGTRYRSPAIMTIHPKRSDSRAGLHLSGQLGDITVLQYRIDLSADDLDAEMRSMANCLRRLMIDFQSGTASAGQSRAPA